MLLAAATGQCMVGRVVPGSPAALGGAIWLGDVVESVNERAVPLGAGSAAEASRFIEASEERVVLGIRWAVTCLSFAMVHLSLAATVHL